MESVLYSLGSYGITPKIPDSEEFHLPPETFLLQSAAIPLAPPVGGLATQSPAFPGLLFLTFGFLSPPCLKYLLGRQQLRLGAAG